jgi:septum formation protein
MIRFVLASQSPRRRELLGLCGYPFDTMAASVDESTVSHPDPAQDCIQTARLKAEAILNQIYSNQHERMIIVAADTIVAYDGHILGKPKDAADANQMLTTLRGHTHDVHTGVMIIDVDSGREVLGSHTAVVKMRRYTDQEISAYVASGDPLDKAGAYAIQHPIFRPVEQLNGCYLGVMGLSICHLLQLLRQIDLPFQAKLASLETAHQHYKCRLYNNIAQEHGK